MSLKTIVKISSVNNLSDARYCAGMGVEMIGFCLDQDKKEYIEPAKIKEIIGWVAGIKIVGEFGKGNSSEEMNLLSTELGLDYIQVEMHDDLKDKIDAVKKPVIVAVDVMSPQLINILSIQNNQIEYFLIHSDKESLEEKELGLLEKMPSGKMLIGFGLNNENILPIIEKVKPAGISLKGSKEISPGLKSFDELSDILERLEVED